MTGQGPTATETNGGVQQQAPQRRSRFSGLNPSNFLRNRSTQIEKQAQQGQGAAPRGVMGMLKNLTSGIANRDFAQIGIAFDPTAAKKIDTVRADQAKTKEASATKEADADNAIKDGKDALEKKKLQSAANKTVTAEEFLEKFEGSDEEKDFMQKIFSAQERKLKQAGDDPKEIAKHTMTQGKANAIAKAVKDIGLEDGKNEELLKKMTSEIMKHESNDFIDDATIVDTINNKVIPDVKKREKKRNEKIDQIKKEVSEAYMDEDGDPIVDDKGHLNASKAKVTELKDGLNPQEKALYDTLLESMPEEMKDIKSDTKNLHLLLIARAKSGKKMRIEDVKKLAKAQKTGKLSKMTPATFEKNLSNIIESKMNKMLHKDLKDKLDELNPKDDKEAEMLKNQIVPDLMSQEEWDKLSEDDKMKEMRKQKHQNQFMDSLPKEAQEQLKALDPKARREALEKMNGGHPFGSPQAMANQMDPEMQKKIMKQWEETQKAQQDAMQQQNKNGMNAIDNWLKGVTDMNKSMQSGIASAAQAVQSAASGISSLRQSLMKNSLDRMAAQESEVQRRMSRSAGGHGGGGGGGHY